MHAVYTITQDPGPREGFGDYTYRIYRDGVQIATYWHDYRGDDHGLEFNDGRKVYAPVGRMIDFLGGEGGLSAKAIAWLKQHASG